MASTAHRPVPASIPELAFGVERATALEYAAVPTVQFALRVEAAGGEAIRSILLDVQIQIAARRRSYDAHATEQLTDLFGTPDRWGETLRTLPWVRPTVIVPPFTGSTVVDVPVTCTYDLEVSAAQYLQSLRDGAVPLEFLFSGTVFFAGPDGALQTVRIPWTQEAEFALPVATWREAIDRHFPDAAWLRLGRESFERLRAYRAREALASWDDAVAALLAGREGGR
jgi:hypothetical protein